MKRYVLGLALTVAALVPSVVHATTYHLSQAQAFAVLHVSCGGIQQAVTITSQDASTTVGTDRLSTRCGVSGRGGGYKSHTYIATPTVTWDTATGAVLGIE